MDLETLECLFPFVKKELGLKKVSVEDLFTHTTKEILDSKEDLEKKFEILIAERFIKESLKGNFIPKDFLNECLKERPLKGTFLKVPLSFLKSFENLFFFEVERGFFFNLLEISRLGTVFKHLWKKGIEFLAFEKELTLEDLSKKVEDFSEYKLIEKFDLELLNEAVKSGLRKFITPLELDVLLTIEKAIESEKDVIWLQGLKELPQDFNKVEGHIVLETGIFIWGDDLIPLAKNFSQERQVKGAGINKNLILNPSSPLLCLIGTIEHVLRLKDSWFVSFQGFTYHVIGDLLYEWGNLGKALKYYAFAESHTLQPVELILSKAAICFQLGDLKEAEALLKKGLCASKGKEPAVYYNLGLIYLKQGDLEKAKEFLYRAYLLSPDNQVIRETLGECLWKKEDLEELLDLLKDEKDLSSKEKCLLGKLFFKKKDYERAFELLKSGLNSGYQDGEALLFLGWLYLSLNKEKKVFELLLKEAKELLSEEKFRGLTKGLGLGEEK